MIRFKVIRGSRLMLVLAVVVLALVLGTLILTSAMRAGGDAVNTSASLVDAEAGDEAKTEEVFASSNDAPKPAPFPLDPEASEIDIDILTPAPVPSPAPVSVLIYHTHTHEAYEQVSEDPYEALEAWRTADADHSVVRVGAELARRLEALGFEVVHDVTDHEGSELSTAYSRSLTTLQRYARRFDLYIDLHRDAYAPGMSEAHVAADGTRMAQLMMLIGNGNGFETKPYYDQNYAFARALAERVNDREGGLCKEVLVKDGRYNQHIGVFAVLVEVGHNRNTLQEALNAVPALAEGLYSLLITEPDPALIKMKAAFEGR